LHVFRRKAVYEQMHPDTRIVRVRGGPGRGKKNESQIATGFIDDTAAKTKKYRATVSRDARRADKIAELRDAIGTSLDKGDELDVLADLPLKPRWHLRDRKTDWIPAGMRGPPLKKWPMGHFGSP
jgi:hypothetical protein